MQREQVKKQARIYNFVWMILFLGAFGWHRYQEAQKQVVGGGDEGSDTGGGKEAGKP